MKINQVYIDLDGVLANTVAQLEKHLGIIYDPILGEYDFTKTFDVRQSAIDHVFDNHHFWSSMPVYHWADTLIEFFLAHGIFVFFVTHAVDSYEAFSGKYDWFARHFHKYKSDLIFIRGSQPNSKHPGCRHNLAAPDRLLVDDHTQNVAAWVMNSGPAILFPQTWNENHEYQNNPMSYVMDRFAEISQ
jgi:5'(3')-deoxyribonucleotidase